MKKPNVKQEMLENRLKYERTEPKFLGSSHERMKLVMRNLFVVEANLKDAGLGTEDIEAFNTFRGTLFDLQLEISMQKPTRCAAP